MMLFALSLCCTILILFLKFLNWFDHPTKPRLHHSDSGFVKRIISRCPSLHTIYQPPQLWGQSGHIQTAIYGKLGRFNCPRPTGKRYESTLPSGETVTFDIFQPFNSKGSEECVTIFVCPGIANSSEKSYVRTFIQHCRYQGYRVACLNHVGSLPNVKLTTPRIFTYGETKYFSCMVDFVMQAYSNSKFLMVGFSMGGNIVVRYLAEDKNRQKNIVCAVSLCQGYDALRSTDPLTKGYRRIYSYLVAANFKKILKPHWKELFNVVQMKDDYNFSTTPNGHCKKYFDEEKVKHATSMRDIEDGLLRFIDMKSLTTSLHFSFFNLHRRHFDGHASVTDFIQHCGCAHLIHEIDIPILLLNAEDDPLIVTKVHDVPHSYSTQQEKALFVTTKHGGHLGFYKGKWYKPDTNTFLEDVVMEYIEAVQREL